jgi:hypothetical protein
METGFLQIGRYIGRGQREVAIIGADGRNFCQGTLVEGVGGSVYHLRCGSDDHVLAESMLDSEVGNLYFLGGQLFFERQFNLRGENITFFFTSNPPVGTQFRPLPREFR